MASNQNQKPLVGIIMGSQSDWDTMQHAAAQLAELNVPHEVQVISAHRTPRGLCGFPQEANGKRRSQSRN